MKKNFGVAVIFGGVSSENEVSVITGTMVCNVLKRGGERVLPVYIDHDGVMRAGEGLADVTIYKSGGYKAFCECAVARGGIILYGGRGKPKELVGVACAINCCHGGVCEGGAIAGAFALCGIPFASAGLFESSAFMDKYLTKLVLQSLGAKLAKYVYSRHITGAIEGAARLGYPVIVKPVSLGSSIGICKASSEEQLKEALKTAFLLDDGVLIEQFLSPNREINCAAYLSGGKITVSECEEAIGSGELLTYDDKYSGGGKRVFPADLGGLAEQIKTQVAGIYSALNLRGIVRFDYIICRGECYLSEINTVPGSLSQYLLSGSYKGFYGVLKALMQQAATDQAERASKRIIKTGILNNLTANTCKLK